MPDPGTDTAQAPARACAGCGHRILGGRFCTHCGQPIAGPDGVLDGGLGGDLDPAPGPDTAERRAARHTAALGPPPVRTPPASDDVPGPARFQLYADEPAGSTGTAETPSGSGSGSPDASRTRTDLAPVPGPGLLDRFSTIDDPGRSAAGVAPARPRRRRRSRTAIALALLLVLCLAAATAVVARAWVERRDERAGAASAVPEPASDLTATAQVDVPDRAPDSREVDGGTVSYAGANLLDGDPTTAWRVAGDASGEEIVLTFPTAVRLSRLGLVNGYAKESTDAAGRTFDWYDGHRTVSEVVWILDGGTEIRQPLGRTRDVQDVDADAVSTRSVRLRIVDVSAPGSGRAARDFTAISGLVLEGTPVP